MNEVVTDACKRGYSLIYHHTKFKLTKFVQEQKNANLYLILK
jgi:hypothetical protein